MTPEEAAKAAYEKRPRLLERSASDRDSGTRVVHWEELTPQEREKLISEHWGSGPEMVERVKAALEERLGHVIDFKVTYGRALLGMAASDVIEAMREPNVEVMEAAIRACSETSVSSSTVQTIWQAAIDAALREEPSRN
jgi:hypothetical protein